MAKTPSNVRIRISFIVVGLQNNTKRKIKNQGMPESQLPEYSNHLTVYQIPRTVLPAPLSLAAGAHTVDRTSEYLAAIRTKDALDGHIRCRANCEGARKLLARVGNCIVALPASHKEAG